MTKFSVIIPAYNAEGALRQCLDGVFSSFGGEDYEVIVVDNKSRDATPLIIKDYPCRLMTVTEKQNPAIARNIGVDQAKGEILVFVDSDILINKDTLTLLRKSFEEDGEIVAVTGMLSKECPHKDFFTQYKNLYMHYIFKRCPRYVDFLYGSIAAIKREDFLRFDESLRFEDTELGQRYKRLNKKIYLNKEIEVIHLKKYDFIKIVKNDFSVPFWWAPAFMMYRGFADVFKKRRFAHAGLNQLFSILVSYLMVPNIFFLNSPPARVTLLFLALTFLFLNYDFFKFLYKERRALFLVKSILFTWFDMLVMGLGLSAGLARYLLTRLGRKNQRSVQSG